jgi:hypothetical protein
LTYQLKFNLKFEFEVNSQIEKINTIIITYIRVENDVIIVLRGLKNCQIYIKLLSKMLNQFQAPKIEIWIDLKSTKSKRKFFC